MATSPVPMTDRPKMVEPALSAVKPAWHKYGTPLIVVLLAIAVIATITHNWNAWEGGRVEQATNDAYVRGDLTPLSTKVPGLVREVKVNDYQSVRKGEVLVQLDDEDYKAQVAQAAAGVEAAKAALENNRRQRELQDSKIDRALAGIDQANAQITAALSGKVAVEADVTRTRSERTRQETLIKSNSTTQQRVEAAVADEQRLAAQSASRDADVVQARTLLRSNEAGVEAERRTKTVFLSQEMQLLADLHAKEAGLMVAQVNLGYTRIAAPADGTVGERQVRPGQLVTPGTQVMTFVEDLRSERVQQVKYGSTLEADLIESRAQALQAKQELLTSELQLSDLRMQFNDVVGLPIKSEVVLDSSLPAAMDTCEREQCIKLALDSHPEIAEARAVVEKASAGVRAAKREYIPDVEAFARYSYQNDVPFLARNFGTFGIHFSYDIFDGGKKRSMVRERDAQLAQARENLARISDEVELRVQTAYNKVERTQQMIAVSQELLAARGEARRVSAQQLMQGAYLRSQAEVAAAQEFEAQTLLLQSQLDYAQAQDELTQATGLTAK